MFERDLDALNKNYFWAPNHLELNDPCETVVSDEILKNQVNAVLKLSPSKKIDTKHLYSAIDKMMKKRSEVGIYSLSSSYKHELLWAHYAYSHKGFCIQYNLDLLIKRNIYQTLHFVPVTYRDKPPDLTALDISTIKNVFKKIVGTKSTPWNYEKEIRIITDKIGENDYDYSAVTGIYFGLRMPDEYKEKMMNLLKGRGIKYYQMFLKDRSYQFIAQPLTDKYKKIQPYLYQISQETEKIEYKISKKEYAQFAKKGTIEIQLEQKITETQLQKIALDLKNKIFRKSKRVFMSYFLPEMMNGETWATTHFESGNYTIRILGFTIEQEIELQNNFEGDTQNIIGQWIDTSPHVNHGLTLFEKENNLFLERKFTNGSSSITEMKSSEIDGWVRYDDIEDNAHGEYFTVDGDGVLHYFSSEEEFMSLKPYKS